MAHRIPIQQDNLRFQERQNKVWEDMERDMDMRRKEWESDIDRMRGDFFNLRPCEDGLDSLNEKFRFKDGIEDAKSVIEKDQNGRPVFRARFNVKDYQPEEVNVKMDGDRIIVHAEHQEKDGTKSVSREFSREVNIPREVDPLLLQCTISSDGILSVEAPLPTPQYPQVMDNTARTTHRIIPQTSPHVASTPPRNTPPPGVSQPPSTHTSSFTTFMSPKGSAPPYSSVQSTMSNSSPKQYSHQTSSSSVSSSKYDTRNSTDSPPAQIESEKKFRVEVDIEDFNPEELSVKTIDKKLVISASRMERIGSRTSTKELNREFHLPDTVDPMAVKAFFSDTGKMIIEAPYMRPIAVGHFSGHEGSPLSGR
jgi:HSP20 family molecular chaperone IbpA